MNAASTTSGTTLSMQDWNNQSFRDKFGSLFQTDNQKRLEAYAEADMARMQARTRHRFKVEDSRIDTNRDVALGAIGINRTPAAQSVQQSFAATTGAEFKAMALRA